MNAQEHIPSAINVAVFSNGNGLVLVRLEADANESASADAVARGYSYAGVFGVNDGVPSVQCEPGFEAAMVYAGVAFAEMLGPHLKQEQLAQQSANPVGLR